MEDLRKLYSCLGFSNIESYIQSGNVVFQTKEIDNSKLELIITEKIKEVFGFDVPVIVFTIEELKVIINNNPFLIKPEIELTKVHITFLSDKPEKKLIESIDKEKYKPDEFEYKNKAIYLHIPISYGKTKLENNFFEKTLKVKATTRNLRTSNKILEIAERIDKN